MSRLWILPPSVIAIVASLTALPQTTTGSVGGQAPRPQARQTSMQPGTSRIWGAVSAADTGRPLRGATVQLTATQNRSSRTTTTDATGAYEFAELPAGSYTLNAGAARYLALEYGQGRPDADPVPITLRENQQFEAKLALPRLGAIGGSVLDPFGDPVPGVGVFVFREDTVEGLRRIVVAGRRVQPQLTNDLGHFRIFGLPPGDYYVGALSGVMTASPLFNNPNESGGFVPTFYPGVRSIADAQTVRLAVGQDLPNLALTLIPGRGLNVSGTVVDSTGQPLGRALMSISPVDSPEVNVAIAGRSQATVDGKFTFSHVPPGTYVVQGRSLGTTGMFEGEFGWLHITVANTDVSDLNVTTAPGSSLSGRIVFDGESAGGGVPLDHVRLAVVPPHFDAMPVIAIGPAPSTVNVDGAFQIRKLWGPLLIRAQPPPGWMLERVTVGGKDVTDTPVNFIGRALTGAEIVLSKRAASISGRVIDGQDQAVVRYQAVVFSADPARWTSHSRFVATAPADNKGAFWIGGLPPGDYLGIAVPFNVAAPIDQEFLKRLRGSASALLLPEGETRNVELPFWRPRQQK